MFRRRRNGVRGTSESLSTPVIVAFRQNALFEPTENRVDPMPSPVVCRYDRRCWRFSRGEEGYHGLVPPWSAKTFRDGVFFFWREHDKPPPKGHIRLAQISIRSECSQAYLPEYGVRSSDKMAVAANTINGSTIKHTNNLFNFLTLSAIAALCASWHRTSNSCSLSSRVIFSSCVRAAAGSSGR
jgi:hypothetical protein